MAHLRDTAFGLPRFSGHRLAWLVALPLLIFTLPARSGASLDEAPAGTVAQPVAVTAPVAGVPVDPAVTPAAAIVTPAAKPESGDQQRRVLMLLLMNSAGPVRPYGNLGR
ncbi:MAG TPA: hypothetical protein VJO12_13495 [Stellaceae bacterium]|nr:hypothetical protein [Stellaceae bacterium]